MLSEKTRQGMGSILWRARRAVYQRLEPMLARGGPAVARLKAAARQATRNPVEGEERSWKNRPVTACPERKSVEWIGGLERVSGRRPTAWKAPSRQPRSPRNEISPRPRVFGTAVVKSETRRRRSRYRGAASLTAPNKGHRNTSEPDIGAIFFRQ